MHWAVHVHNREIIKFGSWVPAFVYPARGWLGVRDGQVVKQQKGLGLSRMANDVPCTLCLLHAGAAKLFRSGLRSTTHDVAIPLWRRRRLDEARADCSQARITIFPGNESNAPKSSSPRAPPYRRDSLTNHCACRTKSARRRLPSLSFACLSF